jgi:hypothetical protein
MKTYHIFHAVMPQFEEIIEQERKYVGSVLAESLEHAFVRSQNLERHWNQQSPCRSTSVGDVIQSEDNNIDYLVAGIGFKALIQFG